ncbi:MFS transporter [Plantactinospora veratri]|uniref:MFS transporter n=1 Tax=Plantactinospora veratri TaxID=1436122 RepID=A0ABU7SQ43_9ACTN
MTSPAANPAGTDQRVQAGYGQHRTVQQPKVRRNLVFWFCGHSFSLLADQVYFVVLAWAAVRSVDAGFVGVVLAAGAIPRAVLMLVGGVLVDRFAPRLIMISSNVLRIVTLLVAVAYVAIAGVDLWMLLAVAVVFGVVDALFWPAADSFPAFVVPPDQLTRTHGMRSLAYRVSAIAGAPFGGLMVAISGIEATFGIVAAMLAMSTLALVFVQIRQAAVSDTTKGNRNLLTEMGQGLRYLLNERLLRTLFLLIALMELAFASAFNLGVPLLVNARGWGADGLGLLVGCFGVGATLGALFLILGLRLRRAGLTIIAAVCVQAVAIAGLGIAPDLWQVAAATAVIGLCASSVGAITASLVQSHAPMHYIGRAMSVMNLASFGLVPVAYAATGFLAEGLPLEWLFFGATAVTATAAFAAAAQGVVRRSELPSRVPVQSKEE